jgi:glycosyltransferase involved in cell wall biosynthesis
MRSVRSDISPDVIETPCHSFCASGASYAAPSGGPFTPTSPPCQIWLIAASAAKLSCPQCTERVGALRKRSCSKGTRLLIFGKDDWRASVSRGLLLGVTMTQAESFVTKCRSFSDAFVRAPLPALFLRSLLPVWNRLGLFGSYPYKLSLTAAVRRAKQSRAAMPFEFKESPNVSLTLLSYNHRGNIEKIVDRIRLTAAEELIICEDGSVDGSEEVWRRVLTRPNDILINSNDIHEIRSYNRAISLARGELVAVLQDDDIPPENPSWVADAITLFQKFPKLAVLGCWNGAMLNLQNQEDWIEYSVGPGYLSMPASRERSIDLMEPESRLPFQFIETVGIGPIFFRRADFEALGGFDIQLSRPGEPGIWLDYDICLRAWLSGRQVGVYQTDLFQRGVGGSGTFMFASSQRAANFNKNLKRAQLTFAGRMDAVRGEIDKLNRGLVPRA